jgi:hypothetical protein
MAILRVILGIVAFAIAVKLLAFILAVVGFALGLIKLALILGAFVLIGWVVYRLLSPRRAEA